MIFEFKGGSTPPLFLFLSFFLLVPSWRDHSVEPLRDPNPSDLLEVRIPELSMEGSEKLERIWGCPGQVWGTPLQSRLLGSRIA